jgi:6-phosphogluconolactonase (cycloisomerase 2 family)
LTQAPGSPYSLASGGDSVVIDPAGRFAYVLGNGISGFSIDPSTGALTAVSAGASVALSDPSSFTIDPSGQFAYAVGRTGTAVQTGVYAYTIDAVTDALTPVAGNPVATSSNPVEVTVTN